MREESDWRGLADRVRLVYIKGGDAGKAPLRLTATGADGAEALVHDNLVVNETAPCAPARRDRQRLAGLASRCVVWVCRYTFSVPRSATQGGSVRLTCHGPLGVGGMGRCCQISEVWLLKGAA